MGTVLGYRVEVRAAPKPEECGVYYSLDPPELPPEEYVFDSREIVVELAPEAQVKSALAGRRLVYSLFKAYGTTLADALRRGWCRVKEERQAA